ncbi:MAG: helix-turn-helix domain-containing protein [Rubrobacteraceae bacterium]
MDPKLLLDDLSHSPDISSFRELVLPLSDYDSKRGSGLIRTLSVYFDTGTNASETADRLFLHRNSLLYRLERIQELTGLDLKEPDSRLALQLGLLAISEGENNEAQYP